MIGTSPSRDRADVGYCDDAQCSIQPLKGARNMFWDADLLVIGAGIAGLTAATRVVRNGGTAIVVEKDTAIGGNGRYAGYIWTAPTRRGDGALESPRFAGAVRSGGRTVPGRGSVDPGHGRAGRCRSAAVGVRPRPSVRHQPLHRPLPGGNTRQRTDPDRYHYREPGPRRFPHSRRATDPSGRVGPHGHCSRHPAGDRRLPGRL